MRRNSWTWGLDARPFVGRLRGTSWLAGAHYPTAGRAVLLPPIAASGRVSRPEKKEPVSGVNAGRAVLTEPGIGRPRDEEHSTPAAASQVPCTDAWACCRPLPQLIRRCSLLLVRPRLSIGPSSMQASGPGFRTVRPHLGTLSVRCRRQLLARGSVLARTWRARASVLRSLRARSPPWVYPLRISPRAPAIRIGWMLHLLTIQRVMLLILGSITSAAFAAMSPRRSRLRKVVTMSATTNPPRIGAGSARVAHGVG